MLALDMAFVDRAITKVETLFATVADLSIFSIMLVAFSDIVMRYMVNQPLDWAYDVISLYLMAAAFFLSLSGTYTAHGHIGMELFVRILPPQGRRVADMLTCILSIPLFGLIAFVGGARAYQHWMNSDAISGLIPWPTWIGTAFVPAGAGLLVIRMAFRLVIQSVQLVGGTQPTELMTRDRLGIE